MTSSSPIFVYLKGEDVVIGRDVIELPKVPENWPQTLWNWMLVPACKCLTTGAPPSFPRP